MPLRRDVIYMATADEEAGGYFGAGWLVENRPEIFDGVGYLVNEGGGGSRVAGSTAFSIEHAQKRPYWLRLTATDQPGHGSSPRATSAPGRLIAALNRIQQQPFEARLLPGVKAMFANMTRNLPDEQRAMFDDLEASIQDPAFVARLQGIQPRFAALLRNTCSITMLEGSDKINVVPPTASAELDCRILPDQDADAFLAAMRARIADDQIEIEELMLFGAAESSVDTDLYRTLESVTLSHYPGAGFGPSVSTGFTDSHFFRDIGVASYGYSPMVTPIEFVGGVHGNNERIEIAAFEKGIEVMIDVLTEFAGPVAD